MSERITIIEKHSNDLRIGVDLPDRADVVISEIVDHVLIGEEILPTLEHALKKLAKPHAPVIPSLGQLFVGAFESRELYSRFCVSEAAGFDVSLFNEFSPCGTSTPILFGADEVSPLSDPILAFEFDFSKPRSSAESKSITVVSTRAGTLHGVLVWFELALIEDLVLHNRPWRQGNHWANEVYLLDKPRRLAHGDKFDVLVEHDGTRFHMSILESH